MHALATRMQAAAAARSSAALAAGAALVTYAAPGGRVLTITLASHAAAIGWADAWAPRGASVMVTPLCGTLATRRAAARDAAAIVRREAEAAAADAAGELAGLIVAADAS
jgi:hypothetical protein